MTAPREDKAVVYYDCSESEHLEHTDPDDAVEAFLENYWPGMYEKIGWRRLTAEERRQLFLTAIPSTVTLTHYRRKKIDHDPLLHPGVIVEWILERLDEEYGDPDSCTYSKPSQTMLAKAQELADVIRAEYEPWMCEPCDREQVDIAAWLKANPQYLDDGVIV